VLDFLANFHDIFEFLVDDILSLIADLDLEKVGVVLPLLWDISDFDLLLDGLLELSHLLLECFSLWGLLEVFGSHFDSLSLWIVNGGLPSLLIGFSPFGLEESLIGVSDIIDLIGEIVHFVIWEMNTLVSFLKVVLKNLTDISPLLDHLLSEWGLHESSVDFLNVVDLLGVSPLLERVCESIDWLGALDLVEDNVDVVSFALDSLLTLWADLNLEGVDGIMDGISGCDTEEKCDGEVLHI